MNEFCVFVLPDQQFVHVFTLKKIFFIMHSPVLIKIIIWKSFDTHVYSLSKVERLFEFLILKLDFQFLLVEVFC